MFAGIVKSDGEVGHFWCQLGHDLVQIGIVREAFVNFRELFPSGIVLADVAHLFSTFHCGLDGRDVFHDLAEFGGTIFIAINTGSKFKAAAEDFAVILLGEEAIEVGCGFE
jgi:hypothetical protein